VTKGKSHLNRFLILAFIPVFLASFGVLSHNAFADSVTATIPVGKYDEDTAVNPNTNRIYVSTICCDFGNSDGNNSLLVLDGATNSIESTINLAPTSNIAVNPNTNRIYVGDSLNSIAVINGSTNTIIDHIQNPAGIIVTNPNTNKIYVANDFAVSVIDGATDQVIKNIQTCGHIRDISANVVTNQFYIACHDTPYMAFQGISELQVIDGSTDNITKTINFTMDSAPVRVGINPVTNTIYIESSNTTMYVMNGNTDSITGKINGVSIGSIAVNPNTNMIYVANQPPLWKSVSLFNGSSNTFVTQLAVGTWPGGISVNPNTNRLYVSNAADGTVSVIQASASNTSTVSSAPQNLQVTAGNSQVTLSWTTPSSNGGSAITSYNVYRGTTSGGEGSTPFATGITSTSYTDTTVTNGQTYFYKVTAVNSVGESSPSNEANATPAAPAITPPTGITLNNIQSTSGTTSSSNQVTLSNFNAGTGNNRLLVVGISANNNDVSSITFGGMSLTRKAGSFYNNDAEFWYLKNPTGSGDIVVTMNGPTSAIVGAYSFSGVNQTSPLPTSVSKHNTSPNSPNISITTKYANDWVLDLPSIYGGSTLDSPTCTQQWDANVPNAITGASSSNVVPTPGAVTCKWTASSADFWDDAAIEIKASK